MKIIKIKKKNDSSGNLSSNMSSLQMSKNNLNIDYSISNDKNISYSNNKFEFDGQLNSSPTSRGLSNNMDQFDSMIDYERIDSFTGDLRKNSNTLT